MWFALLYSADMYRSLLHISTQLPLEPFSILLNLTHRSIEGENYREASAHVFFAIGLLIARQNTHKIMEWQGLKVSTPTSYFSELWKTTDEDVRRKYAV